MEQKLEQLNETLRDIVQVLANIYIALRCPCRQEERVSEREALEELCGDSLLGSSIQVCAKCSHFGPESRMCDVDGAVMGQSCDAEKMHCPLFNPNPNSNSEK